MDWSFGQVYYIYMLSLEIIARPLTWGDAP